MLRAWACGRLQREIGRDRKVAGSIPGRSGEKTFSSTVTFQYELFYFGTHLHPTPARVTAVAARKRPGPCTQSADEERKELKFI